LFIRNDHTQTDRQKDTQIYTATGLHNQLPQVQPRIAGALLAAMKYCA